MSNEQDYFYVFDFATRDPKVNRSLEGRVHVLAENDESAAANLADEVKTILKAWDGREVRTIFRHGPYYGILAPDLPEGVNRYRAGFQLFPRGTRPVLFSCIIEASNLQDAAIESAHQAEDYRIEIEQANSENRAIVPARKPLVCLIEPILLNDPYFGTQVGSTVETVTIVKDR